MPTLMAGLTVRFFEFNLVLTEGYVLTEDVANALFDSGCDDGSPGMMGEFVSIEFCREAESLEIAIESATRQVRSAGFEVDRAEIHLTAPVGM